jgi:hypothetical protein
LRPIIISGHITACGVDVRARVRILDDVTCSSASKGYLDLKVHQPPGQRVTLVVSKAGYYTASRDLVLEANGHTIHIDLQPKTPTCEATEDCLCPSTESGCQPFNP